MGHWCCRKHGAWQCVPYVSGSSLLIATADLAVAFTRAIPVVRAIARAIARAIPRAATRAIPISIS